MKKIILLTILTILATISASTYAGNTVNAKLSTLGLGVEAVFPVSDGIDARLGINSHKRNFSKSIASGGATVNYSGDLQLESFQALADWHPWSSSFRVSGGLLYNNNELVMRSTSGTFNIAGVPVALAAGEAINATVDFNKVAPYLGVGWGRAAENTGLSFTSDIGVVFQGSPKGTVTTNIAAATAADVAAENASLNDSLKSFRFYPVISVGIGYTF